MIKFHTSQKLEDCCGCKACEQVCAKKAISFTTNDEGFEYPLVNREACVDCGLCEQVCPIVKSEDVKYASGVAYAAQNTNKHDIMQSSSGGAFVALAKAVLEQGGVVYGAAYDNGPYVKHTRVDNVESIEILMGSKYVQSDINTTYQQAKRDLQDGKWVYFTGTPCQIAGLRLYLRKDYDNLLTSDLVCHGTPSPAIFANIVKHMGESIGKTFVGYSFRDKRIHGWSCSSSSSWEKDGKRCYIKYSKDMEAYFKAFISGDLMRMNCYTCPFATKDRVSDITLADYWGVRRLHPEFPEIHKGVSLVIVNSEKGVKFFKMIEKGMFIMPIDLDVAASNNHNLLHPTPLTSARNDSYKLAFSAYDSFVARYYKRNYIKERCKVEVEYIIRKYPFLFKICSMISKQKKKKIV